MAIDNSKHTYQCVTGSISRPNGGWDVGYIYAPYIPMMTGSIDFAEERRKELHRERQEKLGRYFKKD